MVVLELLFPYGFIYEMGPLMSEKQVKESQSRATPPSFRPSGGRGVTIEWYQSVGLGVSGKLIRLKMYLHSIVLA